MALDGFQTFHSPHPMLTRIAIESGPGPEILIDGKNCVTILTIVKRMLKHVKMCLIVFALCFVTPNHRSFRDCILQRPAALLLHPEAPHATFQ